MCFEQHTRDTGGTVSEQCGSMYPVGNLLAQHHACRRAM